MPGSVLHALHALWRRPERGDEFLGTLVNAWLAEGGDAVAVAVGEDYVDTGTLNGYRAAIRLLERKAEADVDGYDGRVTGATLGKEAGDVTA